MRFQSIFGAKVWLLSHTLHTSLDIHTKHLSTYKMPSSLVLAITGEVPHGFRKRTCLEMPTFEPTTFSIQNYKAWTMQAWLHINILISTVASDIYDLYEYTVYDNS